MSHPEKEFEGNAIWVILFFFVILTLIALICYSICFGIPYCLNRLTRFHTSCQSNYCGSLCDFRAFFRERESNRQAREQRRLRRRMQQAQEEDILREFQRRGVQFFNLTSSTNDLVITPDTTFGRNHPGLFSSAWLTTVENPQVVAERMEFRPTMDGSGAWGDMNSFGFVVVPPSRVLEAMRAASVLERDIPGGMTSEERRETLEQVIEFKPHSSYDTGTPPSPINAIATNDNSSNDSHKSENDQETIENKSSTTESKIDSSPNNENSVVIEINPVVNSRTTPQTDDNPAVETKTMTATPTIAILARESLGNPNTSCSICLEDFEEGELLNVSKKCPHVFHKECLLLWLVKHDICPCCRAVLITSAELRQVSNQLSQSINDRTEDSATTTMVTTTATTTITQNTGDLEHGAVTIIANDDGRDDES